MMMQRDEMNAAADPMRFQRFDQCVARETLGLLKSLSSPEVFRRITYENGVKLFKVPV